jgi:hypothetical protein
MKIYFYSGGVERFSAEMKNLARWFLVFSCSSDRGDSNHETL